MVCYSNCTIYALHFVPELCILTHPIFKELDVFKATGLDEHKVLHGQHFRLLLSFKVFDLDRYELSIFDLTESSTPATYQNHFKAQLKYEILMVTTFWLIPKRWYVNINAYKAGQSLKFASFS